MVLLLKRLLWYNFFLSLLEDEEIGMIEIIQRRLNDKRGNNV